MLRLPLLQAKRFFVKSESSYWSTDIVNRLIVRRVSASVNKLSSPLLFAWVEQPERQRYPETGIPKAKIHHEAFSWMSTDQ